MRPKTMFIGLLLVGFFNGIHAVAQTQRLVISNLNAASGKLYVAWYNDANSFRKPDKAVLQRVVEVPGGQDSVSVIFEKVREGTYAVAVFFDRNNNGRIDTNIFGMPKEKYGFSNNVFPFARAASFTEAAFKVTAESQSQTIRLR